MFGGAGKVFRLMLQAILGVSSNNTDIGRAKAARASISLELTCRRCCKKYSISPKDDFDVIMCHLDCSLVHFRKQQGEQFWSKITSLVTHH